jgi:fumarylacetoacetate (FAA) hydrolase
MKLASIRDGSRDGALCVIDRTGERLTGATAIAPSLQAALDDWDRVSPKLQALSEALDAGRCAFEPLDYTRLLAPLPRAYEWVDGSTYVNHIVLARRARGAEPPATLLTDPLVYQGGSGVLLGARDPLTLGDPSWGLDFEAEIAVVLGDTPRACTVAQAQASVRLLVLANDVTYRNLVPDELAKGFGFLCAKPATAFSPFAITPDELGAAWRGGRVYLRMRSYLNETLVGDPEAGEEMHFSFFQLIAHLTKTRAFTAGTIVGSGTVSNRDAARGVACLAEKRMREQLEHGHMRTAFLRAGDRVRIEMLADDGTNLFGSIDQVVDGP